MLRCKKDELCVMSRTNEHTRGFLGRFVTTVRLAKAGDFGLSAEGLATSRFGPIWVVSFNSKRPKYPGHDDKFPPTMGVWPDAWLRPIRHDGSLFDETMFWVKQHA